MKTLAPPPRLKAARKADKAAANAASAVSVPTVATGVTVAAAGVTATVVVAVAIAVVTATAARVETARGKAANAVPNAGAMATATWIKQLADGNVDPAQLRAIWTSPGYCHCNFTVLQEFPEELGRRWTDALLRMTYDNPRWRELMDLEGLKQWLEATPEVMAGYASLWEAVERQGLRQG